MSREWKPGDVALASNSDVEFRVVRHHGDPDYWSAADGVWPSETFGRNDLDVRPLVVIDIEDHRVLDPVIDLIWGDRDPSNRPATWQVREKLKALLLAPPKPEEPTDPAVRVFADSSEWARVGPWWVCAVVGALPCRWDRLVEREDFRVLSEGVPS